MAETNESSTVRLGVTGVGGRGESLLGRCLEMSDVEIPAVCDSQNRHQERAIRDVVESGRPEPESYRSHDRMIERAELDGVIIATPWDYHIPMAIAAMEEGIFVGLEVGPASTIEACWDLVRTAEETGTHCMLLENCCYYRDTMAVLNMVRQGVFGELVHCECGYGHDLRGTMNTGSDSSIERIDGRNYRGLHHEKRNGDLYPTHGIGPIAKCLEINRGNRFVSLNSTASKCHGLADWADKNLEPDHPSHDVDWSKGDIVTTVLKCANGETVTLTHDVSLPRPYSNMYQVQGTNGLWQRKFDSFGIDDQESELQPESAIHLETETPGHSWESFEEGYQTEYEHPLWERYLEVGPKSGHGGIDHLVLRDYVTSVKRGTRPPIDVYDTATWMAISPLSERSIERGNDAVSFPDFTNGAWMDTDPCFGLVDTNPDGLLE